jgi:hypothetical protein
LITGPPLHEHDLPPDVVVPADSLACPDDAKAAALVQLERRNVLREDPGLDRPDPVLLRAADQLVEQRPSDAAALSRIGDVDAVLGDTCVDAALGNRGERGPADDLAALEGHEAVALQVRLVPVFPGGSLGLEGGVAAGDPLLVDRLHGRPVLMRQLPQLHYAS